MTGFFATYAEPNAQMQLPFDIAVIIPTILRPELGDALRSIFAQDLEGRIQVLLGIDAPAVAGDLSVLNAACAARPPNCVVQVFYPGYSTSVRHGGLSPARDGGVLRCILSYLANSVYIAYLDDDNWWRPDHLRLLRQTLGQADWAFSLRWFVHPVSRRAICVDQWESVGPGKGLFRGRFGGFVDPNCLMLRKASCEGVLSQWNRPLQSDPKGMSADRNVFDALRKNHRGASSDQPTVFYKLDPDDGMHPQRLRLMGLSYEHAAQTG